MNQSLINELRAHAVKIQVEMHRIEKAREISGNPIVELDNYSQLLLAKSQALNGIAVLVAANKR